MIIKKLDIPSKLYCGMLFSKESLRLSMHQQAKPPLWKTSSQQKLGLHYSIVSFRFAFLCV